MKEPPVSRVCRVGGCDKVKSTVWQETAPGLGERSTAYPGQQA